MPLLDWERPVDELGDLAPAGALVERAEDLPVTDLAGLRHRQELEAIERIRSSVEIRLHHLLRLLLHLASLIEDGRLLALERSGDLGAALLRFLRLVAHALELVHEV